MAAIAAHGRLRRAFVGFWLAGALLAGATAIIAAVRNGDVAGAAGYAATAAALLALAAGTARGSRPAIAIGLVVCAVQPLAVAVTAWELTHRIPQDQAAKVRSLGVTPTVGVSTNLCLAACASILAVWAYRVARRGAG